MDQQCYVFRLNTTSAKKKPGIGTGTGWLTKIIPGKGLGKSSSSGSGGRGGGGNAGGSGSAGGAGGGSEDTPPSPEMC